MTLAGNARMWPIAIFARQSASRGLAAGVRAADTRAAEGMPDRTGDAAATAADAATAPPEDHRAGSVPPAPTRRPGCPRSVAGGSARLSPARSARTTSWVIRYYSVKLKATALPRAKFAQSASATARVSVVLTRGIRRGCCCQRCQPIRKAQLAGCDAQCRAVQTVQPALECVARHRLAEQKTLHDVTTSLLQDAQGRFVLNAFGHH